MPGPFPGMDPYLEDPDLWPSVHQLLISGACIALNATLPSQYVADIGERIYVVEPGRNIYPDVRILKYPFPQDAVDTKPRSAASTAVIDPPVILTAEPQEVREVFIQIVAVRKPERLITTIEVLSPANKTPGSEGRRSYLKKQEEILESAANLVEIDLLREGRHTVAAPLQQLRRSGKWDYLVSLHRSTERWRYEVWGIPVLQRLPCISIPLADSEPDIALDLQELFDRVYDGGAFARRIDYRIAPSTPLEKEDGEKAAALLRERGLRL